MWLAGAFQKTNQKNFPVNQSKIRKTTVITNRSPGGCQKITSHPRNCLHVYDDTPGVNGNYSEFSRPACLKNFCHFFFPLPCQFDLKMKAALFDFDVSSLGRNSTPECTMKTFVQFSQRNWNVVWTGRVQPLPKSLTRTYLQDSANITVIVWSWIIAPQQLEVPASLLLFYYSPFA